MTSAITNNENPVLCAKCLVRCCEKLPGSCYPEDFGNSRHKVEEALLSGQYTIDWWEGEPPLYFVRPSERNKIGCLLDPSWGGVCNFLTDTGCSLSFEQRPSGCRDLIPGDKECAYPDGSSGRNNKHYAARLWEKSGIDLMAVFESCEAQLKKKEFQP